MSRNATRPLLIALTLALVAGPAVRAQLTPTDDPFDKARARGLREGSRAEPQALRQALREAARAAYSIRLQRVKAGTGTPDLVLEDLAKLLDADLALAKTPAARERYWAGCREVELL